MMKKTYMLPQMKVFKMHVPQVLCGSITQDGDKVNVTFSNDTFGEDETINARGTSFWDE